MDAFPAFFPLTGRKVIIAGSGEAADAKARLFDGSPAKLSRVEGLAALSSGPYVGALLAFIAGDELFCEAAAKAARGVGVLVNVVDRPAMSDFNAPAVVDRGEVVVAIGTGGAAPMLAALLRNDIEARIPEGAGRVAALFRKLKDEVREAFPDMADRRVFLREAFSSPAAEAAAAGDMKKAEKLLREAIAKPRDQRHGRIRILSGKGPADLVTLRAARALAEADVIVADAKASPDIVALARRDAQRLTPKEATAERLIELAASGQVVRIITAPIEPALIQALAAAKVTVEVLAVATA